MIVDENCTTLINGEERNTINIDDRGLNYGDGIFETIAVHDSAPILWDLHWLRLKKSCEKFLLKLPDKEIIENELVLLSGKINKGIVKIILTRGSGLRGYKPDLEQSNTRILTASASNLGEIKHDKIEIFVCKYTIYPDPQLAGIKHLNRLPQVMASIEQISDAKMGILCDNNNNIVEAISANIFIVINGILYTPDLTDYGVAGVMREYVIEKARKLNIKTEIVKINKSRLEDASEVFLTNSIIGIRPVYKYNTIKYEPGSSTKLLMQAINQDNYNS